jgi:nitrile hydratase beta subunit
VDGIHDLGGMHGFGPVATEDDEPPFHEPWEGRVHGLMIGVAMVRGIDGFRYWIESMGNEAYLSGSYYEHWLHSLERILVNSGDLVPSDLDAAVAAGTRPTVRREDPAAAAVVPALFTVAPTAHRDPAPKGRFGDGDRVRVAHHVTSEHNRVPGYVRGAIGTVESLSGEEPLEEGIHRGAPQPVYTVVFEGRELWGEATEPDHTVVVDLFEQYLVPA